MTMYGARYPVQPGVPRQGSKIKGRLSGDAPFEISASSIFKFLPDAVADIFRAYGARLIRFKGGHINALENGTGFAGIQALFKSFIFGTFFEYAFDGFFRMLVYRRIRAEKGLLPRNPAFDAIGQFLVLFLRNVDCTQIEDESLPGTSIGTDVFNEMQVLVVLFGTLVSFADFFNVHAACL